MKRMSREDNRARTIHVHPLCAEVEMSLLHFSREVAPGIEPGSGDSKSPVLAFTPRNRSIQVDIDILLQGTAERHLVLREFIGTPLATF